MEFTNSEYSVSKLVGSAPHARLYTACREGERRIGKRRREEDKGGELSRRRCHSVLVSIPTDVPSGLSSVEGQQQQASSSSSTRGRGDGTAGGVFDNTCCRSWASCAPPHVPDVPPSFDAARGARSRLDEETGRQFGVPATGRSRGTSARSAGVSAQLALIFHPGPLGMRF